MRIFLITGASIGVVGTLAGFALGVLVCLKHPEDPGIRLVDDGNDPVGPTVRFLTQIPADMSAGETFSVLIMALVLSLLATLYPSWRAAKLDPVEAFAMSETAKEEGPVLWLQKVERRYSEAGAPLEILKGADFAIWPGETVALIAPSGTGKSTLLHVAGLLEAPEVARSMSGARRPRRCPTRIAPHPAPRDRLRLSVPHCCRNSRRWRCHPPADDPWPHLQGGEDPRGPSF